MSFFRVKVQFEVDTGKKIKHINKLYVVDAVSPTEAEIKTTSYLSNPSASAQTLPPETTGVFEVRDCVCTNFEEYIK